jgi:hypothetical protein
MRLPWWDISLTLDLLRVFGVLKKYFIFFRFGFAGKIQCRERYNSGVINHDTRTQLRT